MADVNRSLATQTPVSPEQGSEPPFARLQLPEKLQALWEPSRYKVLHGGRGGAKSWGVALTLLVLGSMVPLRILCARELQVSIQESVHKLLSDLIMSNEGLRAVYGAGIEKRRITNSLGTEFMFEGLRNNVTKIKSMEGIDIVWVEEAEKVSHNSWQVLIPTLRKNSDFWLKVYPWLTDDPTYKPQSEIWVTFNPDLETDPTFQRFVMKPPPGAKVVEINWRDNPWFPDVLRDEMRYLYRVDPDAAEHVWGGKCRTNSAAAIFRGKWVIDSFVPEPDWEGPYYGADWGFSVDPTALVKLWIKGTKLYIEHEAWAVGCDIDKTPELFDTVPGARRAGIKADSARPETISYMQRHGYDGVIGVEKWPGSVEDGIAFLRSFEQIVIHQRCKHAIEEAKSYSYKVDKLTQQPTTDVLDKNNHIWDAVRYALQDIIRQHSLGMLQFFGGLHRAEEERKRKEMEEAKKLLETAPTVAVQGGGGFR